MASLRETYRVSWDNRAPIEVTTTVQDLIDAVEALAARGYANNRPALVTSLIHCALERTKVEVPLYTDWVLLLDSYDLIAPGGGAVVEGPTKPEALLTEPSPSPASPGLPGGPGSDATPGP